MSIDKVRAYISKFSYTDVMMNMKLLVLSGTGHPIRPNWGQKGLNRPIFSLILLLTHNRKINRSGNI